MERPKIFKEKLLINEGKGKFVREMNFSRESFSGKGEED